MNWIALKMLTGNRAKYYAIIFGVSFAVMLMSQQLAIFTGLMRNTASQIRDLQGADIWVMDPSVQFVDDLKPLADGDLYPVRGVLGVSWAVRLYKGLARASFPEGKGRFKQFVLLGLDDATFVGAPPEMLVGSLADLRQADAVIIDAAGYRYLWPGAPLAVGRTFEMNDRRAVIVGICKASPTFQTFPIAYTRYSQAIRYVPPERRVMSFVLAQGASGIPVADICRRIREATGLQAVPRAQFARMTIDYYMKRTGIPINFGITVLLGFILGCAIAGQTFSTFVLENLSQFGALKAMGVTNTRIVGMVLVQALVVGAIGYGVGVGLAAAFGELARTGSRLAFYMAWQIPVATAAAVLVIVLLSSLLSIRRVLVLEPAVVFRG